ncbi:MAG: hypothetical protein C4292_04900 [Nitrososphaera sp.]
MNLIELTSQQVRELREVIETLKAIKLFLFELSAAGLNVEEQLQLASQLERLAETYYRLGTGQGLESKPGRRSRKG